MERLSNFLSNSEALLAALVGGLMLIYTGIFRALGGVLSKFTTPIAMGYWFYWRSDNPNKLNITLNIINRERLDIDTIVADRLLTDIYKNHFVAQMVKLSGRRTTPEDPVVTFPPISEKRRWFVQAPKSERHLYEAAYNPLISEVSEKTNNIFSFMTAIGLPMREYRFVLALTYEKDIPGRDQHFRCMMILEAALQALPTECPRVDHDTYRTRYRTLCCVAEHYRRTPSHFGVVKLWLPEAWAAGALPMLVLPPSEPPSGDGQAILGTA